MKRYAWMLAVMLAARGALAGEVNWQKNYDDAIAKAKQDKKIVMVDVYTDWCGWCKRLDKDVYSDKDVQGKLSKDFIALKINPEKSAKNQKLAEGWGTRGYPHIVFVDATGKKVDEINGYLPASQFGKRLEMVAQKAGK